MFTKLLRAVRTVLRSSFNALSTICTRLYFLTRRQPIQPGTISPSYKRSPNYPIVKTKQCTPDIGYIRVETYGDHNSIWDTRDAYEKLKKSKAIIFDARYCDGGSFENTLRMIEMSSDWGTECSFEAYIPQENKRIRKEYRMTGGAREVYTYAPGEPSNPQYENREFNQAGNRLMVVLGDDDTEGGAEIFLVCLKENNRAKFIGTATKGYGWERIVIKSKDGREYYVDDAYIYSPNGRPLCYGHGYGVRTEPDKGFEVQPNKDIEFGSDNDNQLQFAVDYLTNELAKKPKK